MQPTHQTEQLAACGPWEPNDDAEEIRFSLTALGEAVLAEAAGDKRFRGFGPCAGAA